MSAGQPTAPETAVHSARVEASLRERLGRLESIIEGSQVGTWEWNVQTDRMLFNERWAEMLGYTLAELGPSAETWRRLAHPQDRITARQQLELHFSGQLAVYECEFRMRHKSGHWVWMEARARVSSRTASGQPLMVAGVLTDVSARKRAEEEARVAQQQRELAQRRSAEIIASVDGIVWEADAQTFRFTFVSAQAERMLGYPVTSWLTEPGFWTDRIHPDDLEFALGYCVACTREMRDHRFDYRFRAADGRYIWMQDVVSVVVEDGQPKQLRGIMMDITARKSAEEALRASEAFLATIYQHCDMVIFVVEVSEDGRFTWSGVNPAHERLIGLPDELVVGRSPRDLIDHIGLEGVEYLEALYSRCVRERAPVESEFYATHEPARGWWFSRLSPQIDGDGRVIRLIGTTISITSRKRAEEALRESEERLRLAVRSSNVGLWDWELATDRVQYSSEWKAQLGYQEHEIGDRLEEWKGRVHPDDLPGALARVERYLAKPVGGHEIELRMRHRDGSWRWIYTRAEVVRDEAGKPVRLVGCHLDVTERRLLEEQLRHSQRMDAVGQLAGGIAHDFNNLLTVIQGNGSLLQDEDDPLSPEQRSETLAELLRAADRAAGLTRQLLTFSRRQRIEAGPLDLNAVVRDLLRMLQRLLGEDVQLELDLEPTPLAIVADASLLEQVLVNLAVNARDAMPEGGRLQVETRRVRVGPGDLNGDAKAQPGLYAQLRVTDSGLGIAPQHLSRIFEPFFTTKDVGKGTGLGLATVFGIVQDHGGWVRVDSQVGRGTRFDVYLPLAPSDAAARSAAPSSSPSAPDHGTEAILVVEDEESVRCLVERVLSAAGYRVVAAASGAEALALLEQGALQVDLVVTDVIMPGGVSGQELGRRLREGRPGQRILYMSGYPRESSARDGSDRLRLPPGARTLAKPFTPASLLVSVRECLAAS